MRKKASMNESQFYNTTRPSGKLLQYYVIKSILTGPGLFLLLPVLLCRYYTLRYKFDSHGISVKWGLLFRRETNLAYSRIQDINLVSGVVQRYFGLGDVQIQTASGSAAAEIVIEGITDFEELRDILYSKMRGVKKENISISGQSGNAEADESLQLLKEILEEMRSLRQMMESKNGSGEKI